MNRNRSIDGTLRVVLCGSTAMADTQFGTDSAAVFGARNLRRFPEFLATASP
jgi:hypothetical protein